MQSIQGKIEYILIVIGLYFFLFNPILPAYTSGMGTAKLVYPMLLLLFTRKDYKKYLPVVYPYIKMFSLIIAYALFESIRGSFSGTYVQIINLIELVLLPFTISVLLIKKGINLHKLLYIVASVGIGISLLCYINPVFNSFITALQPTININEQQIIRFRNFGLSSELAYGYALALGLISGFAWRDLSKTKLLIPFLILSGFIILINARTGFFALIVSIISYSIFSNNIKNLISICISIFVTYVLVRNINLSWINTQTIDFIADFFNQIEDLFTGSNKSDYDYVGTYTDSMLILPENIFQWVFGRGVSVYGAGNSMATSIGYSDIGWIVQLNYGGLIYIGLIIVYFKKLIRLSPASWVTVFLVVCAILFNIKGPFFGSNGGFKVMHLVLIYSSLLLMMEGKYKKRIHLWEKKRYKRTLV